MAATLPDVFKVCSLLGFKQPTDRDSSHLPQNLQERAAVLVTQLVLSKGLLLNGKRQSSRRAGTKFFKKKEVLANLKGKNPRVRLWSVLGWR